MATSARRRATQAFPRVEKASFLRSGAHPLCYEPVDRSCLGGHMVLKNKPCHVGRISCGQACGGAPERP